MEKNVSKEYPKKFEDAINRLEEIVEMLDNKDIELEKALSVFEEGVKLVKFCSSKLEETKKKIEILVKKDGVLQTADFLKTQDDDEQDK